LATHLLETAEMLAAQRGYLRDPIVVALLQKVPAWFRAMGTPSRQVEFQQTRGFALPAALCEFYARLPLACFLHAAIDGHIFSAGLSDDDPDPPPVVRWTSGPHVVFAYHPHSASVCAAAVDQDDPLVAWGFEDEQDPDQPVGRFSLWVYGIVDRYEQMLDQLQAWYENPKARMNSLDWIFQKPRMNARLGR
jgi:hypothetical protein